MKTSVHQTNFENLKLIGRGKVRDIYDLGGHLLIVASDRISAFDVIMDQPIPDKGRVLTAISAFWFEKLAHIIPNHLVSMDVTEYPAECQEYADVLEGRSMLVVKAQPLKIECVVRGYLAGSGWKDYQATGKVCGHTLPAGLTLADRLEEPIFTPATKAEFGEHDENIDMETARKVAGAEIADQARRVSLELYTTARSIAEEKGIILADTKFEFGLHKGRLILIDEVLTPDSSRFWPQSGYRPGISPPSFDKQFLRDYLETLDWDKTPPPPVLPSQVLEQTSAKYHEALRLLTGRGLG